MLKYCVCERARLGDRELNMIPNGSGAIVFRGWFTAVLALCVFAGSAPARPVQADKPASITGVYNGTYAGANGPIKFKLSVTQQDNGTLAGTFTMYLPDGSDTKAYTCDIKGRYIAANRMLLLSRGKWETQPPGGVDMLGMNGQFDPGAGNGAGQISGKVRARPSPEFQAIRDADESAKMVDAAAAKKDTESPAQPTSPVAPPTRGAAGTNRAAPRTAAAPQTPAAPAPVIDTSLPTAINGVYRGGYQCTGNVLKARLSLKSTDDGALTGYFTFELPASAGAGSGSATYKLTGKYDAKNRWPFQFTTVEPVGKPAPDTYTFKTLSACFAQGGLVQGKNGIEYSLNPDKITGPVSGGRGGVAFSAARDKTASAADLDKAMEAQASGAANSAPAAPEARPAFEGVYNGTVAGKQGTTTKFKLTLSMVKENRAISGDIVNTDIAGVLALDLPGGSGTKTYTGELAGMINPQRNLQLTIKRWEARPPINIGGLNGKFDPDGGGHGVGQITGYLSDANSSKLQATRDAAESAKLDVASLTGNVRPGIPGVFNGTYTRANEPPVKMKLTITRTRDGLAGVATIYLPSGAGTKPYTYSLIGSVDPGDKFHLAVHDWETVPPQDFKDFKAMGFNGKFVLDLTKNTAQIVSAPAPESLASFYVPQFEATWDAKESANIDATLAAQKSIGSEEQAAALKAHDEMIKNAPPKELASKDVVRKSRKYWDGYQGDMIREVFDGGFGPGIDENKLFQETFCTYVEMFFAKFPGSLPANRQTVTNTVRTNRKFDKFGNLLSEENHDYSVDMDPRFVEGYKRCWSALHSKGEELRTALAAAQPGGTQHALNNLMGVATDMQKFFADHGPKTAATRQLNENFVLAVHDQPSLQQAGGKIDGAEAESDKDLPPGRYARFVDGANAYYRERAKSDPVRFGVRLDHDTALNQRLAELYQFDMSPDENYYYANDFAARFLPIMGPRAGCPDPAWPRLHPAVEKAIAEVK
jgi:hypothetical protein